MNVLTVAEIDSELAARGREIDAVTASLLELDKHPGLTLLRGYPPVGATAARWRPLRERLDLMWEDFGRLQSILDQARAIRARRTKPTDADRAELTRLLRDRPHELARVPIPLSERSLTGPGERVLFVGIADTLDRMRATFPHIAEFLDAVDAINSRVLSGLAPLQAQLDRFGGASPELRAIGAEVSELVRRSATDPLAFTAEEIDSRIAAVAERLRGESEALAELRSLVENWAAAIAETGARLDDLRAARERALAARAEAERTIHTAPIPVHPDVSEALRCELESLAARYRSQSEGGEAGTVPLTAAGALLDLRLRTAAALETATADEQLARGLLDRRTELRGRLAAYQAKAARLGVSEDPDVLSSNRIASGLLSRRPCDLAAVTRAVADYQQIIVEKSGRRG
ncbi:hypothetical protein NDR87_04395 [Nocardia sp. CDC159]|uniref:Uncharacterized protein n=1 Tax=Nocardia pulmonis TaxID=2951408 RepID=A0A9X2E7U0_9NOCA|nr:MULTISPECIES: hypothetical protein [Nocardia]MCM6773098.1 hypothetical protein [Nocardia pulmonis]MCM6785599.1 hypothetical protein [Nocardia sp. CDC159]